MTKTMQAIRDALAEKEYAALLYKLIPRIIREADEGRIIEIPELPERPETASQDLKTRIKGIVSELRYQHRGEPGDAGMDWLIDMAAEAHRLQKCRDGCKIVCLLDEYNKVVAERDTLKTALKLEVEESYGKPAPQEIIDEIMRDAQEQEAKP